MAVVAQIGPRPPTTTTTTVPIVQPAPPGPTPVTVNVTIQNPPPTTAWQPRDLITGVGIVVPFLILWVTFSQRRRERADDRRHDRELREDERQDQRRREAALALAPVYGLLVDAHPERLLVFNEAPHFQRAK